MLIRILLLAVLLLSLRAPMASAQESTTLRFEARGIYLLSGQPTLERAGGGGLAVVLGLSSVDWLGVGITITQLRSHSERAGNACLAYTPLIVKCESDELAEEVTVRALRFALLRAATPGQDVPMAEEWVEGARRFANKLWNATRFVLMQTGPVPVDAPPDEVTELPGGQTPGELEDRWILSRLEAARATCDEAYADYDLSRASRALYHFVWDEYCDWYLELAKLRSDDVACRVLTHVLDQALRLLHPIMPFVTEEIWQALHEPADGQALIRAAWVEAAPARDDERAEAEFGALQEVVTALRRFRADHGLAPSARIVVAAVAHGDDRTVISGGLAGIRRLAGVREWSFVDAAAEVDGPVGKLPLERAELLVPLTGLVDLGEERDRLERALTEATTELQRAQRKLANDGFVSQAPATVVEAEREKAERWRQARATLEAQLAELR